MDVYGIRLVGVSTESGRKLLMSIVLIIVALLVLRWLLAALNRYLIGRHPNAPATFWTRQIVNIVLWLELAVRLVVSDRGIREVKDAICREMMAGFDAAGIGIASATYAIVGLPPLRVGRGRTRNRLFAAR